MDPPLHPDVEPLAFLLGIWRGRGTGGYPTVEPFGYEEELEFGHIGKPYLTSRQRTWLTKGEDRIPSHVEFAFWRPSVGGQIEVVCVHANGIAEIELGVVTGTRVRLATERIVSAPTSKDVVGLERRFEVDGRTLTYEVQMAAVGHSMGPHLHAVLVREA
jgi:hypothetical protein